MNKIRDKTVKDWLLEAQSSGGFAFAMSSSFMGIYPHLGALIVLLENGLFPDLVFSLIFSRHIFKSFFMLFTYDITYF